MTSPNSNTLQDDMQFRAQQTIRQKRVKPSMPKMPWDETDANEKKS